MGNIIESTTAIDKASDSDEAVPVIPSGSVAASTSTETAFAAKSDFQRLSFDKLVDFVIKNEDRMDEAGLEFCHQSHQSIKIIGRHCANAGFHSTYKAKPDYMEIYERTLCFDVLQNFGGFITKIVIDFDGLKSVDPFNKSIQSEVNKYCATSLIHLEMYNCREVLFNEEIHPFVEVQSVRFKNCRLDCSSNDLYRLFPVVNHLELLGCTFAYSECIEQSFNSLQHMAVQMKSGGFSMDNILPALCFNQQLSSLHLVGNINSKFLHSISQLTPLLQCLHLQMLTYDFDDGHTVHFDNVEQFIVTLDGGPFINLPISFDHLTELEIIVNHGIHEKFGEFIGKNGKLTKLTIVAPSWNPIELYDSDMTILTEKLTCLTDFTLRYTTISIAAATNFIRKARMLRDFRFVLNNNLENEQLLLSQIENTWKLTKEENSYQCTRL